MWISIVILGVIWVGLLIPVVQERLAWMAYAHVGTGLFFTSLILNLALPQTGDLADTLWLKVIGFILIIPALILFVSSMVALSKGDLVKSGMMGIVRHPMYLGTAIAAFALIFVFQSILSIVLSSTAVVLLWVASIKEDEYNLEQFGDSYREFMDRVPRWNVLNGLRNR